MLLENPKTWDSRELFLPENNGKTCSAVNFQKKEEEKSGFGSLETNQRHEIET